MFGIRKVELDCLELETEELFGIRNRRIGVFGIRNRRIGTAITARDGGGI